MPTVKTATLNGKVHEVDPAMISMIKKRLQKRLIQVRSTRVTISADVVESELAKLIPAVTQKPWYSDLLKDILNYK